MTLMAEMSDELKIFPFQTGGEDREDRIFLARFELPKFGEEFQVSVSSWRSLAVGGVVTGDTPMGFIHFLSGFPIDTVEMLVLVGEFSSKAEKVNAQDGDDKCFSPVWDGGSEIFGWPDEDKILLNRTALLETGSLFFAANLPGEPKPEYAHWWFRVELEADSKKKFPIPGEFLGLGVRLMPGEYWGHQKSSPFIYSGNFMDTVYFTGGVIKEVIEPTDEVPYPTYKVQWRKNEITVNPSDFAEYKVGDRVTILKDVTTTKKSQLWKDEDMEAGCDKAQWQIVPISFYGLDKEE